MGTGSISITGKGMEGFGNICEVILIRVISIEAQLEEI